MSLIIVKNLSKSYEGQSVIKDLNFTVSKGEKVAVIGPNGSGKTTLIRMLGLLESPTSGYVYFDGEKITDTIKKWRIRRRMAVVFQRPAVLNASVYENITVGLKIRGEKRTEFHGRIEEVLEGFNLIELKDKNARTLSGGEKQLLALARAIILEPELLLLDEPTSNLDPENTALAEEVIKNIVSTVIITSPTDSIAKYANRTVYMLDGRQTLIK